MRRSVLLLLLILSACGYKMRRQEFGVSGLSARDQREVWRLYIPVVDNVTAHTGFEPQVTSALRTVLGGIRGLRLVSQESEADVILQASVLGYERVRGEWTGGGSGYTAERGGLAAGKFTAANVIVTMSVEASLFRVVQGQSQARQRLWTRKFSGSGRYDTSRRFYESGALFPEEGGSSSAPFINQSREQLVVGDIAIVIARSVVDQVVADF